MKFQKILVVALLTATISMQINAVIDCDQNPQQCPPGSYKNSSCQGCFYDPSTKTLNCDCRNDISGEWTRKPVSGCSSFKNYGGELACETPAKK